MVNCFEAKLMIKKKKFELNIFNALNQKTREPAFFFEPSVVQKRIKTFEGIKLDESFSHHYYRHHDFCFLYFYDLHRKKN